MKEMLIRRTHSKNADQWNLFAKKELVISNLSQFFQLKQREAVTYPLMNMQNGNIL